MKEYKSVMQQPNPMLDYQRLKIERDKRRSIKDREKNACRRLCVSGAVLDVLGEGRYARVWIGKADGSFFCCLDAKQMNRLVKSWQEALEVMSKVRP